MSSWGSSILSAQFVVELHCVWLDLSEWQGKGIVLIGYFVVLEFSYETNNMTRSQGGVDDLIAF